MPCIFPCKLYIGSWSIVYRYLLDALPFLVAFSRISPSLLLSSATASFFWNLHVGSSTSDGQFWRTFLLPNSSLDCMRRGWDPRGMNNCIWVEVPCKVSLFWGYASSYVASSRVHPYTVSTCLYRCADSVVLFVVIPFRHYCACRTWKQHRCC